jgi:hypothetical protein
MQYAPAAAKPTMPTRQVSAARFLLQTNSGIYPCNVCGTYKRNDGIFCRCAEMWARRRGGERCGGRLTRCCGGFRACSWLAPALSCFWEQEEMGSSRVLAKSPGRDYSINRRHLFRSLPLHLSLSKSLAAPSWVCVFTVTLPAPCSSAPAVTSRALPTF